MMPPSSVLSACSCESLRPSLSRSESAKAWSWVAISTLRTSIPSTAPVTSQRPSAREAGKPRRDPPRRSMRLRVAHRIEC